MNHETEWQTGHRLRPSGLWETTLGPRTMSTGEDADVAVQNDMVVWFNEVAAQLVCRLRRWAVGVAAGPTRRHPSHGRRQESSPRCLLCCACCSALGDYFSSLCLSPFCVNLLLVTLPWSPLFHHTPRLGSTLDCVTVFNFAEPYIIDCVALLYRGLSPLSFSVNYCVLNIAWLILNSGD